jgi:NAD(P)-dependent dehydrogenase (short-subunit alcohol dehydrogenase family)
VGTLSGRVALVTGASRGVGRGVALGLGEAGAAVFVTGRTRDEGAGPEGLPGSVTRTAEEVTRLGGEGVPVACDHTDDAQTAAAVGRVLDERGRLDLLVNSAWGGYENMLEAGEFTWQRPFWEQPLWRWDAAFGAGVRAAYATTALAVPAMIRQGGGLVVHVSFFAARKYSANVVYGVSKAATDRMAADMAHELRPHGVTVVSLYPGLVRTERVMRSAEFLDLRNAESPQFLGRAVAALAADPKRLERSGQALIAAALAEQYGFRDVDGKLPRPLTLDEV